jgi:sulfur-carrier protein adenylyltransferase/sulfurtransferase
VAFQDSDTPAETVQRAYAMEEGLRTFYLALAKHVEDLEIQELFERLSGFEELHQDKLFGLYQSLTKDSPSREDFGKETNSEILEGGLSTQDFLDLHKDHIKDTTGALDLALTIEAQALDLYLRFADKAKADDTRRVVYRIADDEKVHLRYLGEMMGRKV